MTSDVVLSVTEAYVNAASVLGAVATIKGTLFCRDDVLFLCDKDNPDEDGACEITIDSREVFRLVDNHVSPCFGKRYWYGDRCEVKGVLVGHADSQDMVIRDIEHIVVWRQECEYRITPNGHSASTDVN